MQTTFQEIDLHIIRYSLVWEDPHVLAEALQVDQCKRIALIGSAGCNVLNMALHPAEEIHAIDINPIQNLLLRLKKHLYLEYNWTVLADLICINGNDALKQRCSELKRVLPATFLPLLPSIEEYGLLGCGRLEKYIHGFMPYHPQFSSVIHQILDEGPGRKREELIELLLQDADFKKSFEDYYSSENLSKGRDPKLLRFTHGDAGEKFYHRFSRYMRQWEQEWPFIMHFFFKGMKDISPGLLPACYREENFIRMKEAVQKIHIVHAEMIEYISSAYAPKYDAIGLSNIFEYISPAVFQEAMQVLHSYMKKGSRMVFWNLLNSQYSPDNLLQELSKSMSKKESCFYFDNVQIYSYD